MIFTPENPDFELQDPGLENEVPKGLEVLRFPIWEPYKLLRIIGRKKEGNPALILEKPKKSLLDHIAIWLRANLLVPDPRRFWVQPSVNFLSQILPQNKFHAVITTGPPHSMHLIGFALKEKWGLPWIADFRDPWSTWEFLDTLPMMPLVRKKHRKLESKVFAKADAICTISPAFQKEMQQLSGRKIDLLYNGFDAEDMPVGFHEFRGQDYPLHIVYTGVIDAIRDPRSFLKAMKAVFGQTSGEIILTFVGRVSESIVKWTTADSWLNTHVEFVGYVPHKQVFDFYGRAHLLLLILTSTKNAKGNIPGKMFEYMATKKPVLALGDPEGDAATILHEAGSGKVFAHEDSKGIIDFLKEFKENKFTFHTRHLDRFERKTLTRKLVAILDGICEKPT